MACALVSVNSWKISTNDFVWPSRIERSVKLMTVVRDLGRTGVVLRRGQHLLRAAHVAHFRDYGVIDLLPDRGVPSEFAHAVHRCHLLGLSNGTSLPRGCEVASWEPRRDLRGLGVRRFSRSPLRQHVICSTTRI